MGTILRTTKEEWIAVDDSEYSKGLEVLADTSLPFGLMLKFETRKLEDAQQALQQIVKDWNVDEPYTKDTLSTLPYSLVVKIGNAVFMHAVGKSAAPLG